MRSLFTVIVRTIGLLAIFYAIYIMPSNIFMIITGFDFQSLWWSFISLLNFVTPLVIGIFLMRKPGVIAELARLPINRDLEINLSNHDLIHSGVFLIGLYICISSLLNIIYSISTYTDTGRTDTSTYINITIITYFLKLAISLMLLFGSKMIARWVCRSESQEIS